MADPYEIAREALELSEKATPQPWKIRRDESIEGLDGSLVHADGREHMGDAEFIAHAGTHYAAVCRALLAQRAVVEAAVAQEEAYAKVRASDWGTVERDDLLHEAKKCASATGAAVRAYLAAKEQSGG